MQRSKRCFKSILVLVLVLASTSLAGQQGPAWLAPKDSIDPPRIAFVAGGWTLGYTGVLLGLNQIWYADFDKSAFHFFDDSREWLQIDKTGHALSSHMFSYAVARSLGWAGMNHRSAALAGSLAGLAMMSTIEVLDGYSAKWGASASDLVANTAGTALFLAQALLWNEQRIQPKISFVPQRWPASVQTRVQDLYGTSAAELFLKDYNAQQYWLSFDVRALSQASGWPAWLNIAIGYGAGNMLGGFDNTWCLDPDADPDFCPAASRVSRDDLIRYRQFLLSPDIQLRAIPTQNRLLRTAFDLLSYVRIPLPTLEYNSMGYLKFRWLQ